MVNLLYEVLQMTCYQLLCKRANKNGDIVFFGHKTKISTFIKDVDLFANGLLALGLEKGDVVTIYLPTCPQSLVAFYACSKLGMIANIVHPVTPLDQLQQNLQKVLRRLLNRKKKKLKTKGGKNYAKRSF